MSYEVRIMNYVSSLAFKVCLIFGAYDLGFKATGRSA